MDDSIKPSGEDAELEQINEEVVDDHQQKIKEFRKQHMEKFAGVLINKYLEKVNFENKKKRLPKFQNFEELSHLFLWFFGKKVYTRMLMNGYLIYHRIVPRIYVYFLTVISGCGDNQEWLQKSLETQDSFRLTDRDLLISMIGEKTLQIIETLPETFMSKPKEEQVESAEA